MASKPIFRGPSPVVRTEVALETLVYSPCNHMLWLLAQENFIEFRCHESRKLYLTYFDQNMCYVSPIYLL
jgi:hypothetical protein